MPRQARVIVPGLPHHIVQRGHNRNAVFVESRDYEYYLANLAEWKSELGLRVFSYCLMTNHVHLVVEAGDEPGCVGKLMKRLAGRQTRFVNKMERRTGSLWESRYKISPIDTDAYLLQCCRYVELNPVKAGMTAKPEEYEWSSYRAAVGEVECEWLDVSPVYESLGADYQERARRYRGFVNDGEAACQEATFIKTAVERNQLTGDSKFIAEVERRTGVRVEFRAQGRPRVENKSVPF